VSAPEEIHKLVERFDRNLDAYRSGKYNEAQVRQAEAKEPQTKTVLQRQIETTDHQIDRLVYELYELTEDEIRIVEGS
jgi:hypothetical protein